MGKGCHHATGTGPDAPELWLQGANRANRCYALYEASPSGDTLLLTRPRQRVLGCYLLEKYNALSKMLQRELLAAPQGAGRGDFDGDGGTYCGEENDQGQNGDEEE